MSIPEPDRSISFQQGGIVMSKPNNNTAPAAEYKDIANKTHKVTHSIIYIEKPRKEAEQRIVDELCRVFSDIKL